MYVKRSLDWLWRGSTSSDVEIPPLNSRVVNELREYREGRNIVINVAPPKPFWWYTPLRDALVSLGAPGGITYWEYIPPYRADDSTVIKKTSAFLRWATEYRLAKVHLLYDRNLNKLVGCIVIDSKGLVDVLLAPDVSMQSYEQLALEPPLTDPTRTLADQRVERKQSLKARVYEMEELLKSARDAYNLYSPEVTGDLSDPRVQSLNVTDEWIVIHTSALVCQIAADKKFLLGESTIFFEHHTWQNVIVLPKTRRCIPHPHALVDGNICLGAEFDQTAKSLQEKGYFGLYIKLLLDHLEKGVDPTDMVGIRVFDLPRLDAENSVTEAASDASDDDTYEYNGDGSPFGDASDDDTYYEEEEILANAQRVLLTPITSPTEGAQAPTANAVPSSLDSPNWATTVPSPRPGYHFILRGNTWFEEWDNTSNA